MTYRVAAKADIPAIGRMLHLAFGTENVQESIDWAERLGMGNIRVQEDAGAAVACAVLIPMGQFFGGKRVDMVGVAGVAVAPEARGRGIATELMTGIVQELGEQRTPISTLYPATQPLYRRVGYEQAGHRYRYHINIKQIGLRESGSRVRQATDADHAAIKACSDRYAQVHNGLLARPDNIWSRIFKTRDKKNECTGFVSKGSKAKEVDGFLFYKQRHGPDFVPVEVGQIVDISDFTATTPTAAKRLLSLIADLGSICDQAVLHAGPVHPALSLLGQQCYSIHFRSYWLTRITNFANAIKARGYPASINADVHITITDEVVLGNAGKWIIELEHGKAKARRGGRGDVHMHARQFASIYTGFLSPMQLAQMGLIDGPQEAVETLAAMFAGPAPAMADFF